MTQKRRVWGGLAVFSVALLLRVAFLYATPDSGAPWAAFYKGDTPTWLSWARALHGGRSFDLGLPLRPPGVAYLLAGIWNGLDSGLWVPRLIWCVLGSAGCALLFVGAERSFGIRVALIAGLISASSTGLLILSTSLNNETPYLLLVIAALCLWPALSTGPRVGPLTAWALLNAAACLIRAEHFLFFALTTVYLARVWAGPSLSRWKVSLFSSGVSLIVFLAVLAPWHILGWNAIRDFNQTESRFGPSARQAQLQVEQALSHLTWQEGAVAERQALPAFCRRTLSNFVAATVSFRGRTVVTREDFSILDDAFGTRAHPLQEHPFLVLYGGLNFFLANNAAAAGGFSRGPLEKHPPLAGGRELYPPSLVGGLPPAQLTLAYPPHLQMVNHGYRLGLEWILNHPSDALALVASKLTIFWSGTTMGVTGYNLPLGLSGIRRAVDMVVPERSLGVTLWRLGLFLLLCLGVAVGYRNQDLHPWLLFFASKVGATIAFFGYAREGAAVIPVLALLVGIAASRAWPGSRSARSAGRRVRVCLGLALLLMTVEGARWLRPGPVTLDGVRVAGTDPFPPGDYQDRVLRVR